MLAFSTSAHPVCLLLSIIVILYAEIPKTEESEKRPHKVC